MTGRLLSAEELMKYFNGPVMELPQKGGPKDYVPDGSWLQAKRLEHFYKERSEVLSEERVKKKGHLAHGEWKRDIGMVEVIGKLGKFWQTTGHVEQGRYLLFPEEALALVDKGDLEIYNAGLPLSVQECYAILLGGDVPVEHYQVYIHLSRLGYVVFRHKPIEKLSAYEHKLGLNKPATEWNRKKNKRKAKPVETESKIVRTNSVEANVTDNPEEHGTTSDGQSSENVSTECVNGTDKINFQTPDTGKHYGCVEFYPKEEQPRIFSTERQDQALGHSDFSAIPFPSLVPGSVCQIQRPEEKYIPKGISLQKDVYVLESPRYTPASMSYLQAKLEFSHPPSALKCRIRASNWTEYKEQLSKGSDDLLLNSPVGHLWKGKVTPLIKPSDGYSTVSLLEKMKIIQNVNFSDNINSYNQSMVSDVKIIYDVYKPKAQFSKTSPGLPVFRLCIKRHDDRFVTLADMVEARRLSPDGVPVQWAVVDNGDVTFYSFHGVDIPTDTKLDKDR